MKPCILLLAFALGKKTKSFNQKLHHIAALLVGADEHPPYLVSIQQIFYEFGDDHYHVCSGVIISPFWILTSATCVHPTRMRPPFPAYVVVAGTTTPDGTENRQEISVDILRQYAYPDFDKYNAFSAYDIAIFQLDFPLTLNEHVQPVQLPKKGSLPRGKAEISGWGSTFNESAIAEMSVLDYTGTSLSIS